MRLQTIRTLFIAGLFTWHALVFGQDSSSKTQERIWTYDPLAPNAECLQASGCAVWRVFRTAHPWPYQATTVVENGGETVIILSEPPPSLTRFQYREALGALFGDRLLDLSYFRWPTGLDGYLEDIVLRLRAGGSGSSLRYISGSDLAPRSGPAEIIDRLRMLYRLEYGTSDGFWLDTGETTPEPKVISEVKVPVRDLYSWIASDAGSWRRLENEDQPAVTTAQLNAATTPGAFANGSGIVALVAPKKSRLADLRTHFRRFAVASDLIIGAIGNQNGSMLLLARARTLPLSQLPPLRFETFLSFARNRATDIAQSYERQRIFAGKIQTGKYTDWDWAPILLSQQLDDTEFGTLLNQADQILKSWSEHGDVQYYAFPYPKPDAYPFGDEAASEYFGQRFETTSLLFNWNTDGFSEIARVGNQDILAASRTGALRILYRPSADFQEVGGSKAAGDHAQGDAAQKALDAQDYFASRGNSILVRVVQNVLLYQAEQNFLTIADAQLPSAQGRSDRVAAVLEDQAAKWLTAATQSKPTATEDAIMLEELNTLLQKSELTPAQFARLIASPQKISAELERSRQRALVSLREALALGQQAKQTSAAGEAAFRIACRTVGGSLTDNPDGLECEWQHAVGSPRPAAFGEADTLQAQTKREHDAAQAAAVKSDQFIADAKSLEEKYVKALALGKIVTRLSGFANLDAVLSQVVRAGAATPQDGFIRTPSVVLSKNELDAEAVGGHNIDLVPSRVLTEFKPGTGIKIAGAPVAGQSKGKAEPALRKQIIAEPPARIEQVLGKPRAGTLLAEMRNRTNADPSLFADVSARAKVCNCDAVVSQEDDGTILFVRNAPPPLKQVIYGKSGLIDAMGAPPVLKEVHFENFDSNSVENLARTQVLLNSKAGTTGFGRTVADLKGTFSDEGERRNGAEILIARENGEPQFFKLIGDYDQRVSLRERVSWRGAEIGEPSASEWESTFGAEPAGSQKGRERLIVRFGVGGKDALGVSAAAGNTGLLARLRPVVSQWLGRQAGNPVPISAALVDLRESIIAKLKPNQLNFYIKRNGGQIQGAHVDFPVESGRIVSAE